MSELIKLHLKDKRLKDALFVREYDSCSATLDNLKTAISVHNCDYPNRILVYKKIRLDELFSSENLFKAVMSYALTEDVNSEYITELFEKHKDLFLKGVQKFSDYLGAYPYRGELIGELDLTEIPWNDWSGKMTENVNGITENELSMLNYILKCETYETNNTKNIYTFGFLTALKIYGHHYELETRDDYLSKWHNVVKSLHNKIYNTQKSHKTQLELPHSSVKIILCAMIGNLRTMRWYVNYLKYANYEDTEWIDSVSNVMKKLIRLDPKFKKFEKFL